MEPRIIKTEEQHRRFLAEVETLAAEDPDPESPAGARLELLAKLVEDYEKSRFPFEKPDPIDAILFRMEQEGLRQKDIADLLGGKNRASEILARKRPLTLTMIRALHEHLKIPAELLLQEPQDIYMDVQVGLELENVSTSLLVSRRWIDSADQATDWLKRVLAPVGSPAFLKHTLTAGATADTNHTDVWLWLARVREIADSRIYLNGRYRRDSFNEATLQYLVRLSWMERGPQLAKEFLEENGVALVIEPPLPKSRLDGAALLGRNGLPVIGLTLRADRLDNFWFTLLHECVHVWKHLDASGLRAIADENIEKPATDPVAIEREANDIASEALLPRSVWRRSTAYLNPSATNIRALAAKLQISPAIIAGRLRYERNDYSLFTKLIGLKQARSAFPDVRWS
jgi:HTH-type transcriptional regulator / antitoxin HigA